MSRKQAIEQMCKQCIYDPGQSGTWRQQTEACVSSPCPLFKYRPRARKIDTPRDQSRGGSKESEPVEGSDREVDSGLVLTGFSRHGQD